VMSTARLPQPARQAIFDRFPAPYGLTSVYAGATADVHPRIIEKNFEQYAVPIEGQADVLVTGIPFISPYNVHAFLNPLLVQVLAQGYLFNMYRGAPLVKKGGTLIITHPCTDKFDHEQHAPYIDFVHRLLPETRDAEQLRSRYEEKFAKDPAYIQMFRDGHAYHPAHPFFMWYWGENGRQHLGRVIVVGADNEYIPRLLGWETALDQLRALAVLQHHRIDCNALVGELVRPVPGVADGLDGKVRRRKGVLGVQQPERRDSDGDQDQHRDHRPQHLHRRIVGGLRRRRVALLAEAPHHVQHQQHHEGGDGEDDRIHVVVDPVDLLGDRGHRLLEAELAV